MNCHGCKWLDEYKPKEHGKGNGYCAMIVRSKQYKPKKYVLGQLTPGEYNGRCRYPNSERCELYCSGDFATRFDHPGGAE